MGPLLEKRKVKVKVKVLAVIPKTTSKSKTKKVNLAKKKDSLRKKGKRVGIEDIYDDVEAKFTVLAGRHLESLKDDKTPFFAKFMLPSNVSYSFWLIIPKKFGALYLPDQDATVVLVDDWGNEYQTTYLINQNGLSAGWRGFVMAHKLLKGDILFFRLIGPCKLQVHIVRVKSSDVLRAADSLMTIEFFGRETDSACVGEDTAKKGPRKRKKLSMPNVRCSMSPKHTVLKQLLKCQ